MRPGRVAEISAWSLYDFANTVYSLNILSYHLPLWLTSDQKMPEWQFALVMGVVSCVAAFAMPFLGRLSDRLGVPGFLLVGVTVLSAGFTALIAAADTLALALVFFCLSNIFYQCAQVLYNAQITRLGGKSELGFVSGIGVSAGYMGSLVSLFLTRPFFRHGGHAGTFLPTAVLFFVFALPCLVWSVLRDVGWLRASAPSKLPAGLFAYDWRRVGALLGRTRDLARFSVFSLMILIVSSVLIMLMTVFSRNAAGLSESEIETMIILSSLAGIAGALSSGWWYDREWSVRVVRGVGWCWIAVFVANAFWRVKPCFFVAATLGGFSLGSTWTVTRVYLLSLVPSAELGEYYGVFGFLGRIASLLGPFAAFSVLRLFSESGRVKYDVLNVFLMTLAAVGLAALYRIRTEETPREG